MLDSKTFTEECYQSEWAFEDSCPSLYHMGIQFLVLINRYIISLDTEDTDGANHFMI